MFSNSELKNTCNGIYFAKMILIGENVYQGNLIYRYMINIEKSKATNIKFDGIKLFVLEKCLSLHDYNKITVNDDTVMSVIATLDISPVAYKTFDENLLARLEKPRITTIKSENNKLKIYVQ